MNTEKFEIFYVRHGNTNGDYEDRNPCDINISDLGEKQLELLGNRFKDKSFDAVFSSPLVRCVKTAAAICSELKDKPQIELLPQLTENGTPYGYFGESTEYLKRYYEKLVLNTDLPLLYDNITDEDNDKRAECVIKYLRNRFTYNQRILVVSHGSFGNHFLPTAVEMGKGNYILSIENTSVSKIKYTTDGKQRLSFVNDISHLRPLMPEYEFNE